MGCPFAHLASITSGSKIDDHDAPLPGSQASLSQALKEGTAASHRQVERSKGVGMLLHSAAPGSLDASEALHFDRKDYVRWLVMLTSIYITLEAGLLRAQTSAPLARGLSTVPLLQPLLDSGLPALLARTHTLLLDIAAHLATLESHQGTQLDDLVQETRDAFLVDSAEGVDREDAVTRSELSQLVLSLQPHALAISGGSATATAAAEDVLLTRKHLDLLTPAQVHATHGYVHHLVSLIQPDAPSSEEREGDQVGLLLSHAYTRYLGDLSGGQHILKKVAKKWPCDGDVVARLGDGFEFYRFEGDAASVSPASASASVSTGAGKGTRASVAKDLKTTFRESMDGGLESASLASARDSLLVSLVREANVSFEQNAVLFESLLPAQHRMTDEEKAALAQATAAFDHHHHHHHQGIAMHQGKSLRTLAYHLLAAPALAKGNTTLGLVVLSTLSAAFFAWSAQTGSQPQTETIHVGA
ncbi:hypothetical protein ACQY0O_007575 [Thecaphora frezii]